ncbi:hypothetical protein CDV31_009753 [Fusarium ambrosium]|uniref:Heterokaryon incompatibility domain-containing protein n=1 Tax=Fusarium ambrosium TaxID=131363 RepID=A0A428TT85_9HYPO|nr:hypothetical protein CDV31_009753 [Fusarium ambrosium]
MESGNAAREHIDAICQDRSPGPDKRNVEDLENALHLLSEELYSSDTHFLLELLQNADDNEYKASKPSFSLTLTDDAILTHSNETGFTRSNVEAICRIGKSSKVKLDGRRSIGEKGIGFKSVFKVASTVWISSRGYSFKFDKDRPLGMITPIWEELPQEQLSNGGSEGGTFMRLQLSHDCDREQLRKEITSFDPNILIFLRTLKEITLTIDDSNGYSKRVLRGVSEPNSIKILQNDKEIVDYVTFTYNVQDMPSEPKRQGITESDILLAFPVQDNQGQPAAHQVYAFLPIRNYGFNFLLQADFLLTSNREDITTSPWNETLHDSIPRAFAAAVKHLNRTSLRFTWPRCIPSSRELQAPFWETSFRFEQELMDTCVLESEDPSGGLKWPSSLTFVPESFTFEDPKDRMKKAMTLNESTRSKYLSQKYSHDDVQHLKRLGLLELDFPTFVEDLKVHLDRPKHNSKHQPKIWHSRLAELFIQQPIAPPYPESVFELQIIPLHRETWDHWLTDWLGIRRFPPLVDGSPNMFSLSTDMVLIRDNWASLDFLGLLRENMEEYSKWLENDWGKSKEWVESSSKLKACLAETKVQCRGKPASARLDETILLPREHGKWAELENHFPVLDVPDPGSSSWSFLRHFGVRNWTNPELYLEILKTARDDKRSGDYTWVYEAIQDILSQNTRVIKQGFSAESLIFIPATKFNESQWATPKQCVWSGPDLLRRTPVLDRIYGSCKALFKRLLGVKGTTTEILITEVKKIRDDDNIEYIAELFQAIDAFARRDEKNKQLNQQPEQLAEMVASLQEYQIFPIELERYEDGAEGRHMLRWWTSEKTWFIADRPHLRESLADAVMLIAFDVGQLDRMKWIQHLPGIEQRLLSNVAFCRPKPGLKSVPDDAYTNLLRTRAKFISWLIPRSCSERDATVNRLKSAVVFGAERLEVTWVVRDGSDEHCSVPVPSRATVVRGDDGLHIYMNAQDIKSNSVPPEVAESLSSCCNIREESITTLLVLTCKEENIEDELAWRGVYKPVEDDPYPDFDEDEDGEDEQYNEEGSAGNTSAMEKPKVRPEEGPDPANAQPRLPTAQGPFKEVKVDELSHSLTDTRSNAQQTPEVEAVGDVPFQTRRHKKNKNHGSELNDIEGPSKPREERTSLKEGIGHNIKDDSYQLVRVQHLSSLDKSTCSTASLTQKNDRAHSWRTLANSTPAGGIPPPPPRPSVRPPAKTLSEVGESFSQPANSVKIDDLAQLPYVHGMDNKFSLTGRANMIFVPGPQDLPQLSSTARSNPNGFTVLPACEPKRATFTISGADGADLTEFLVRNSFKTAKEWRYDCPNYHIEVHATASNQGSPLVLKTSVMEMARQYRIRHTSAPQDDVFILICIFNSQEEPELRLYVDPWALYSAGKLTLTVKADYSNLYHVLIDRGSGIKDPEWTGVARCKQGYAQLLRHLGWGASPARYPSPAAKSYVWEPLRHPKNTRLLCLQPGDGMDQLRGELKEISLEPPVGFEYFAISYAWGSSLKQFSLWTPQGRIPLTASLYLGLKRLRRKQGKIWLWADAICINQDEREGDDEKARQIVLMTNIFQLAVRVYIWLGEDEDESRVATQFLEEIAPIASARVDGQVRKHSSKFPKVEDPKWSILAKLLERKWFRRVWVAQELVLAREAIVVCGARQMTWDRFHAAVEACFSVVEGAGYSFLLPRQTKVAAVLHLGEFRRDYYSDRTERDELLTLLERFHMAEATRQRDKLFALLSLAKDGKEYTPDYRKPLKDIITDFAGVLVKNGRAMDLLYRARGYSKQFPEFPSWIPNWISSPCPDTISRWPSRTHGDDFAAATSVPSKTKVIGSILYINGCKLGSIKVLGKCRSSINKIGSYLNEIFSKVDEVYSDLTNDEREQIKCQLPIGNASKPSRGGNWFKGDRPASLSALMDYLKRHKEVDKTESHKLLSLRRPDIPTVSDVHTHSRKSSSYAKGYGIIAG